jgi:hypothetical protein
MWSTVVPSYLQILVLISPKMLVLSTTPGDAVDDSFYFSIEGCVTLSYSLATCGVHSNKHFMNAMGAQIHERKYKEGRWRFSRYESNMQS